MFIRVSVLTFRGIRYISKHRRERYALIGDLLSKEEHDIVLLQEVGGSLVTVSFLIHPFVLVSIMKATPLIYL